ncbi:hypothetical protein BGX30_000951 [Mortierella sp. GBA39]|nr:hypothetical protein BGX30_000951 [Mortierella sp. GBA39]
MSERAGHHFEKFQEKELVETAKASSVIDDSIFDKYPDQERLPESVELENKGFQILIIICEHTLRPLFGKSSPSEATASTGERVLESSKIMRQKQTAEFGDVSESDRKVDMLFVYNGVEISRRV